MYAGAVGFNIKLQKHVAVLVSQCERYGSELPHELFDFGAKNALAIASIGRMVKLPSNNVSKN